MTSEGDLVRSGPSKSHECLRQRSIISWNISLTCGLSTEHMLQDQVTSVADSREKNAHTKMHMKYKTTTSSNSINDLK